MSKTIGRNYQGPPTYRTICDYCGTPWYRCDLEMDGSGMLMCLSCSGLDAASLDEGNAEGAKRPRMLEPPREGGRGYSLVDVEADNVHLTDGSSYS